MNITFATEEVFKGSAQKTNSVQEKTDQNELFTGDLGKLNRNDVLRMTVSKVLDVNSSKKDDEFFAEVTSDVEGKGGVLIPKGTIVHGRISQISRAKRLGRDGALDLDFDYLITPDGREISIKGKMSTRLNPVVSTSKFIATNLGYTAVGGIAGGVATLGLFGLNSAIASQGTIVAGGAAVGGTVGLGVALYRKGQNVLISAGDEIVVKINAPAPLKVYKKTAFLQHELSKEGLDVQIKDIIHEKDPFGEVSIIKVSLSISNMTETTFSIYDLALVDRYNTAFYPAIFAGEKLASESEFIEIKSGDKVTGTIPFSVDNVKDKLWLTFYDDKHKTENRKKVAEFSLDNAYRKIPDESKKRNAKLFKKKSNFYVEDNPFQN